MLVEDTTEVTAPGVTRPIRVLVVVTDPHVRSVICWALSHDDRFGAVFQAVHGDDAACCPTDFDVALIDLAVGGLGALGTMAHLRRKHPRPTIVVMSATDAPYLRNAAFAEGATDFLAMSHGLDSIADRVAAAAQAAATD